MALEEVIKTLLERNDGFVKKYYEFILEGQQSGGFSVKESIEYIEALQRKQIFNDIAKANDMPEGAKAFLTDFFKALFSKQKEEGKWVIYSESLMDNFPQLLVHEMKSIEDIRLQDEAKRNEELQKQAFLAQYNFTQEQREWVDYLLPAAFAGEISTPSLPNATIPGQQGFDPVNTALNVGNVALYGLLAYKAGQAIGKWTKGEQQRAENRATEKESGCTIL